MKSRTTNTLTTLLRPIGLGLCVGVITATVILLGAAAVLWQTDIPRGAVAPMAVAAAAIGALVAGLVAALCAGKRGLLIGAVCGTVMALILLIVGLVRFGGVDVGYTALKWAVMTLCGAIGGLIGVNRKRH